MRTRLFTRTLLGAALLLSSGAASAEVCFPRPGILPGLSGPPIWKGAGTLRTELNEPRWAAAPQTSFANDVTGAEGVYRVMWDGGTELSVSFQAPTDPDAISSADVVYFGFTTDGGTGTLAKGVRIAMPGAGTDPIDATSIQQYNYDAGATPKWTTPLGSPGWLKTPSGWRSDPTARWGINFKVDLTTAGINVANPFKIMLAMHKRDESASPAAGVNLMTPDPGAGTLLTGSLFIENPANWAETAAINAGCIDGIVLNGNQIGTRNVKMGNPAPTLINTTNGATNRFFARPTVPSQIGLFQGLFQGKFHVANWGSIAASNAPWVEIPNGGAVLNGAAPAADNQTIEFDCPTNAGGKTCNLTTPAENHQCVYVELRAAPGQTVRFTKASAYTNMDFEPLSDFTRTAEISVKGLKSVLGNDKPRDVYVYVHAKNMPAHGNKQLYLPTDSMASTRRFFEAPAPLAPQVQRDKKIAAVPGVKPAGVAGQKVLAAAAVVQRPRVLPLPNTGIRDLDLNHHQALSTVWPTYDVHVYYDTGKTVVIDKENTKQLAPMFPFTYFHSHEGPLFGFSHTLKGAEGTEVKQLRPNVYLITVPSEGVAKVSTSVMAHETPLPGGGTGEPPGPGTEPKPCPVPPAHKGSHCNCHVPGGSSWGAPGVLAAVAGLLAFGRRRRRQRTHKN